MILFGLVVEASLVIITAIIVTVVVNRKHERTRPDTPEELEELLWWEEIKSDLHDDTEG